MNQKVAECKKISTPAPLQLSSPKNASVAFFYQPTPETIRASTKLTSVYSTVNINTSMIKLSFNAKPETFTALRHYLLREKKETPHFPNSNMYELLAIAIYLDIKRLVAEVVGDLQKRHHSVPDKKQMEKFMKEIG